MHDRSKTLVVVLLVSLGAYAIDCAALTPQQAMVCCKSMRCASHGHHGMNCCKTMPGEHAVIGQASAVTNVAPGLAVIGAPLIPFDSIGILDGQTEISAPNCHAPPLPGSSTLISLRI